MITRLLNKSDLSILNKRTLKYHLAEAEKDYFLALVSKMIYGSSLRGKLVLKGGTAIHHCYLPQTRFSEDLDFTSLDNSITLKEVKEALESEDFLKVKKESVSKATIKIERLRYDGPLGLPNSLKVEIDFAQNVVLPAKTVKYQNAWKVETKVNAMDVREICAEKIRAASDRARYRDFYDLFLLFDHFQFDIKEISGLIARKEVRKPISQDSMMKNWKMARKERESEVSRVYYAHDIEDREVERLIDKIKVNVH